MNIECVIPQRLYTYTDQDEATKFALSFGGIVVTSKKEIRFPSISRKEKSEELYKRASSKYLR